LIYVLALILNIILHYNGKLICVNIQIPYNNNNNNNNNNKDYINKNNNNKNNK
jgi:hypothetical protein